MRIRSWYNDLLIKHKIIVLVFIITLMFSSFGLLAFHLAAGTYDAKLADEAAEVLNLTSATVDQEMEKIEELSFRIMTDNALQSYLRQVKRLEPSYELFQQRAELLERFILMSQEEPYISSIRVIDSFGNEIVAGYNARVKEDPGEMLPAAEAAQGANYWQLGIPGDDLLMSTRIVRNREQLSLDRLGLVIIYIDMHKLAKRYLDFSEHKQFLLFKGRELVYATRPWDGPPPPVASVHQPTQGYDITTVAGRKQLVAYNRSDYSDFLYVNLLDYDAVFRHTQNIRGVMIGFYAVLLLLFLAFARNAARGITQPLELLTARMKEVQKGVFKWTDMPEELALSRDETGHIHRNFRIMIEKINELISENYEKQLVIAETEYKALQAQINPHFLYNTLESIHWMAKINKQQPIASMVVALGQLLRGIISRKDALITIRDELMIVGHYITVQQYRFGDRLDFRIAYSPELDNFLIPKLTVQPIIENAIQHGLEVMSGSCIIALDIRRAGSTIEVTVADNGPGIGESTLEAIRQGVQQPKGTGIGLRNIEDRIRLLFGESYGISVCRRAEGGTLVTVRLPCREEESHV